MWLWKQPFDLLEAVGFFFSGLPVTSISASVSSLAAAAAFFSAAFLFFLKKKKKQNHNWTQEQKRPYKVENISPLQGIP